MNQATKKLEEYKITHWASKYNLQKKGFFPTDLDIVKMEMDKIKFNIEEKGNITMSDLTGGEGTQLFEMREYIINNNSLLTPHCFYNELESTRFNKAMESYSELSNFKMVNTDIFKLKLGLVSNNAKSGTIAICRNNPPYLEVDDGISVGRFEDKSIYPNAETIMTDGLMIMEVPFNMIEDLRFIQKLVYRFDDINIFRFPKSSFSNDKKFRERQIIIFAKKKKLFATNDELSTNIKMIAELGIDKLKSIDEHEGYLYEINNELISKVKIPDLFRYKEITNKTLTNGLESVIDILVTPIESKFEQELIMEEDSKPIIEQTPGHKAVEFAAGAYNGISKSNVLINGVVKKEESITEETDGNKEYEIISDKYTPIIEIVSSTGDYFIKDNKTKKKEEENEND
ncbi:MAG: hypothetical protein B6I28_00430 [Fusobacteriia bacterium 4572_132]|nr:MAG: hypothetical protein B6I28_00430 [Fusobacteriia bacterium 4572_132]